MIWRSKGSCELGVGLARVFDDTIGVIVALAAGSAVAGSDVIALGDMGTDVVDAVRLAEFVADEFEDVRRNRSMTVPISRIATPPTAAAIGAAYCRTGSGADFEDGCGALEKYAVA